MLIGLPVFIVVGLTCLVVASPVLLPLWLLERRRTRG